MLFQSWAWGRFQRKWAERMRMAMTSPPPQSMAAASPTRGHSPTQVSAPAREAEA